MSAIAAQVKKVNAEVKKLETLEKKAVASAKKYAAKAKRVSKTARRASTYEVDARLMPIRQLYKARERSAYGVAAGAYKRKAYLHERQRREGMVPVSAAEAAEIHRAVRAEEVKLGEKKRKKASSQVGN